MNELDQEHDDQFDDIPLISSELIAALRRKWPARRPRITDTDREIFVNVGSEEVIDLIEYIQQKQLEEAHKGNVTVT